MTTQIKPDNIYKGTGKTYRKIKIEIVVPEFQEGNPDKLNEYLVTEQIRDERSVHARVYAERRKNEQGEPVCTLLRRDRYGMTETNGTAFSAEAPNATVEEIESSLLFEAERLARAIPLSELEKIEI